MLIETRESLTIENRLQKRTAQISKLIYLKQVNKKKKAKNLHSNQIFHQQNERVETIVRKSEMMNYPHFQLTLKGQPCKDFNESIIYLIQRALQTLLAPKKASLMRSFRA